LSAVKVCQKKGNCKATVLFTGFQAGRKDVNFTASTDQCGRVGSSHQLRVGTGQVIFAADQLVGPCCTLCFIDGYNPATGLNRFLCGTPPVLGIAGLKEAVDFPPFRVSARWPV